MSRGGRGGARGGMLKGVTWEFDHESTSLIDSKPSDLFPVRLTFLDQKNDTKLDPWKLMY